MRLQAAVHRQTALSCAAGSRYRRSYAMTGDSWRFVYIFFTNGTPYDAPNRSETCPSR